MSERFPIIELLEARGCSPRVCRLMYELLGSFGLPAFEDVVRVKAPTSSDSSTDRGAGTPEYETDLAARADAQAQALRSGRYADLDALNVAEELIGLGASGQ